MLLRAGQSHLEPRLVTAPGGLQTEGEPHRPGWWAAQKRASRRAPGPSLARHRPCNESLAAQKGRAALRQSSTQQLARRTTLTDDIYAGDPNETMRSVSRDPVRDPLRRRRFARVPADSKRKSHVKPLDGRRFEAVHADAEPTDEQAAAGEDPGGADRANDQARLRAQCPESAESNWPGGLRGADAASGTDRVTVARGRRPNVSQDRPVIAAKGPDPYADVAARPRRACWGDREVAYGDVRLDRVLQSCPTFCFRLSPRAGGSTAPILILRRW